jgi:hypothetical protein
MSMLTGAQKSKAVRAWNDGRTLPEIAAILRNRSSVVEAYLQSRDGYPGKIPPRRTDFQKQPGAPATRASRRRRMPEPVSEDEAKTQAEKQSASRRPVTLVAMPWD